MENLLMFSHSPNIINP